MSIEEPVSFLGGSVGEVEAAVGDGELDRLNCQRHRQQAEQALAARRLDRAVGVGKAASRLSGHRCRIGRPDERTRLIERVGQPLRVGEKGLRLLPLTGETPSRTR